MLVVHAAIHLMGFLKAYGLAALPQLSDSISRAMGTAWLLACVLFVLAAALLVDGARHWWIAACPALVLSQIAICAAFHAAKWGTLVNVILLLPVGLALLQLRATSFDSIFARDVGAGLASTRVAPLVTQADLQHLPALVQSYVRRSGALGRPRVSSIRVRFSGQIRAKVDGPWMRFEAEQYSFVDPLERLFLLRARQYGLPVEALHVYRDGRASMQVALASLLRVVDARGPEMDRSETVTVLNDMCVMAPATLIDPRISWQALDDHSVRATLHNRAHAVSATLVFDAAGDLVNFISHDRDQTEDGHAYHNYRWSTPLRAYRDFGGARLASKAEASWAMPKGELVYGRFELVEVEYNVACAASARDAKLACAQ